jgi:hypothetical protein
MPSTSITNVLPGTIITGTLIVDAATPISGIVGGQVAFGETTGFGNGTPATAVTTTTNGTGTGPATPQTIVKYLEVNVGGGLFWMPLVQ